MFSLLLRPATDAIADGFVSGRLRELSGYRPDETPAQRWDRFFNAATTAALNRPAVPTSDAQTTMSRQMQNLLLADTMRRAAGDNNSEAQQALRAQTATGANQAMAAASAVRGAGSGGLRNAFYSGQEIQRSGAADAVQLRTQEMLANQALLRQMLASNTSQDMAEAGAVADARAGDENNRLAALEALLRLRGDTNVRGFNRRLGMSNIDLAAYQAERAKAQQVAQSGEKTAVSTLSTVATAGAGG